MDTFYLLVRNVAYYDKPSEKTVIGVFTDKGEALCAQIYAADNWSDWNDYCYSGCIGYEIRETTAFTDFNEMQRWNDFPSRVLS